MRLIAIFFLAGALACRAADNPAARWEGSAQVPGRDLPLIIDLAQDGSGATRNRWNIPFSLSRAMELE